jgi:hypothetical protein
MTRSGNSESHALADAVRRINDHPASRLRELLPWNWKAPPDIVES